MAERNPNDSGIEVVQDRKGVLVPETLDAMQIHFAQLYGRRNNLWVPSRRERIRLLDFGIGELDDFIVKDAPLPDRRTMFARVPSRIFCIAHGVNNTSVAKAMAEKYPRDKCGYCFKMPCVCSENRPDNVLVKASATQMNWGMRQWQLHLHRLYGRNNEARGMHYIMNRLGKERRELNYFEGTVKEETMDADSTEHEYALELADCMAWVMAAASFQEIDLETAVLDRFFPNCWNCKQKPCICVGFNQKQVRVTS